MKTVEEVQATRTRQVMEKLAEEKAGAVLREEREHGDDLEGAIEAIEKKMGMVELERRTAEEHYWQIHEEIRELHKTKGADLGQPEDPLANLRASELYGVPPWVGCVIQVEDNQRRIQAFLRRGSLADKDCQIENALMDSANYNMLALALFREMRDKEENRESDE